VKSVGETIWRDIPRSGDSGLRMAKPIEMEQALEKSVGNAPVELAGDFCRIDRLWFSSVENHQVGA
jgi:hypothetical protein